MKTTKVRIGRAAAARFAAIAALAGGCLSATEEEASVDQSGGGPGEQSGGGPGEQSGGGPGEDSPEPRRGFDRLLVAGGCAQSNRADLGEVSLNVALMVPTQVGLVPILPFDRIAQVSTLVGETLSPESFTFGPPLVDGERANDVGVAEPEVPEGERVGVDLQPSGLEFVWNGGEARKDDERLVVLMLDNSGTLEGLDPRTGAYAPQTASDEKEQHITWFQNFVLSEALPAETTWFSLVSFQNRLPELTAEFSAPTRNRDVLHNPDVATPEPVNENGLAKIGRKEGGATPLASALDRTYDAVIAQNPDLNPVIVLFTDGVEASDDPDKNIGDSSPVSLESVVPTLVNHTVDGVASPVPVIVLHLQPTVGSGYRRGRDKDLADLACATGGSYIFLERADDFQTNNDLEPLVRSLLEGHWRLTTRTTLDDDSIPDGPVLLSTELQLELGDVTRSAPMTFDRNDSDRRDGRLWFYKD
ncbi:MAG: vWA domain-containing protein [Bradymonadia bacterium]